MEDLSSRHANEDSNNGLVGRVYSALLDTICSGQLPPGTRLAQEWLAERLNVSRQPVGQALALLKSQGFVCSVGRRGLMVAHLNVEFMESIYAVRGAMDRLAVRQASEKCNSRERARAAKAEFNRLLKNGEAALNSGSISELISADIAFHGFIYDLSDNAVIGETMELLWNRLRWVMSAYLTNHAWAEGTWSEHKRIFEAILKGDTDEAERLAVEHVQYAVELIKKEAANAGSLNDRGLTPLKT